MKGTAGDSVMYQSLPGRFQYPDVDPDGTQKAEGKKLDTRCSHK